MELLGLSAVLGLLGAIYVLGKRNEKTKQELTSQRVISIQQKRLLRAMSRSIERSHGITKFNERVSDATTASDLNKLYSEAIRNGVGTDS